MAQTDREKSEVEQEIDLRDLALGQRSANLTTAQLMAVQGYSGPLTDPQSFAGYEEVLPGAAERILSRAERDHAARISNDEMVICAQVHGLRSGP